MFETITVNPDRSAILETRLKLDSEFTQMFSIADTGGIHRPLASYCDTIKQEFLSRRSHFVELKGYKDFTVDAVVGSDSSIIVTTTLTMSEFTALPSYHDEFWKGNSESGDPAKMTIGLTVKEQKDKKVNFAFAPKNVKKKKQKSSPQDTMFYGAFRGKNFVMALNAPHIVSSSAGKSSATVSRWEVPLIDMIEEKPQKAQGKAVFTLTQ
jgi:hypothetical protein